MITTIINYIYCNKDVNYYQPYDPGQYSTTNFKSQLHQYLIHLCPLD
jgi:hypothetical protein